MLRLYAENSNLATAVCAGMTGDAAGRKNIYDNTSRLTGTLASQCADNQCRQCIAAHDFFEAELAGMNARTAASYRKALDSFFKQAGVPPAAGFSDITQAAADAWIARMATERTQLSTARYYLGCMSALWGRAVEAGLAENAVLWRAGGNTPECGDCATVDAAPLLRIARRTDAAGNAQYSLVADILLFSQGCGGMDLPGIVEMRKEQLILLPECARRIGDKYASARRGHVFPLGQSRSTVRRIVKELNSKICAMLSANGGKCADYSPSAAAAMWLDAALLAGVSPGVAVACAYAMPQLSTALMLVAPDDVDADGRRCVLDSVAAFVADTAEHWHAMRLRRGVGPDDVRERVLSGGGVMPVVYYPVDEIVRRVGRSLRRESRAYIPDVLFFKARYRDIAPLFRVIGDMAWCYRETNSADAPYATISDAQMFAFQHIIGSFTTDVELMPYGGTRTLGVGRRVRITGGAMAGYEGVIYDAPALDSLDPLCTCRRIFSIRVLSDLGIQWSVDIDEAFIEEI